MSPRLPVMTADELIDLLKLHGFVKIPVCREIFNIITKQGKGLSLLKIILHKIPRRSRKDKGEKNKNHEMTVYYLSDLFFFLSLHYAFFESEYLLTLTSYKIP